MIYFVQGVNGGPIKIGYTAGTMQLRLAALQSGSPVQLRALSVIPDGTRREEGQLHERFAAARLHGEWFNPVPELLELARSQHIDARSAWELPLPSGEHVQTIPFVPVADPEPRDVPTLHALRDLDEGYGLTVRELREGGLAGEPWVITHSLKRLVRVGHVHSSRGTSPTFHRVYRAERSNIGSNR